MEHSETKITRQIPNIPRLSVFGGGHVGQAVAKISAIAGFTVTVYEDRDEVVDQVNQI